MCFFIRVIDPRRACAARVTTWSVCVFVCVYAYFSAMGNEVDSERYQRLQRSKNFPETAPFIVHAYLYTYSAALAYSGDAA